MKWNLSKIAVKRNDVRLGCRGLASEQHQIFYRTSDTAIVVLRVLHVSMKAVYRS